MRAAALSFAGAGFNTRQSFLDYVFKAVSPAAEGKKFLLVFPGHLALLFAFRCGDLGSPQDFSGAVTAFVKLPPAWHNDFLNMQRAIARRLHAYLVPGSIPTAKGGKILHGACLLSPAGKVLGRQYQLFLSREEREMGWSRGTEVKIFSTELGQLGIVIGTDVWYPEVGRVLALQGADIVCHCGALPAGANRWQQVAGMWQQVQQNQFFGVESQLTALIAGRTFGAPSFIHAPCEMTPGYEGVLARSGPEGEIIDAVLDGAARQQVCQNYPLLKLLNPAAYLFSC